MIIMHATFSTEAASLEDQPFGGEPRAPTHKTLNPKPYKP